MVTQKTKRKKLTEVGCSLSEQVIIIGEDSFRPDGSDHDLAVHLCLSFQNKSDYDVIEESLTATRQENVCYAEELVLPCRGYLKASPIAGLVRLAPLERRAANFMLEQLVICEAANSILGYRCSNEGKK